jgi:hypothetical protein
MYDVLLSVECVDFKFLWIYLMKIYEPYYLLVTKNDTFSYLIYVVVVHRDQTKKIYKNVTFVTNIHWKNEIDYKMKQHFDPLK